MMHQRNSILCFIFLLSSLTAGPAFAQPVEAAFITKLTASDAQAGVFFGYPVDVDGDVLAVGAATSDDQQGAVYIYRRQSDGTWAEEARLTSSDGAPRDQFGNAVALDGDVLLVGALQHYVEEVRTGAVYIFQHANGTWTEQKKIVADDKSDSAFFGESIALDGPLAFIGASGIKTIYVYDRATWTEQSRLEPFDAANASCFACSMTAGHDYVVVGDLSNDAAFVYRRNSEGDWENDARLTDDDVTDNSYFGENISIQQDKILFGAYADDEGGAFAGAVYLYQRGENGWGAGLELIPSNGRERLNFGRSVLLERDRAFIGSAEGIYVFAPDENGTWVEIDKIDTENTVSSIDIDQDVLAAGMPFDDEVAENAGAVLLYALPPTNHAPTAATLLTPDGSTTIDLSGDPAQPFIATWSTATDDDGDLLTYTWQLGLTADLATPILAFEVGGETRLETSYGTLATALTAAGVATGASVTAYAQVVASDGTIETPSAIVQLDIIRGVLTAMEKEGLPGRFMLHPAYPNPFNPQTTLRYEIPTAAAVRLSVYNAMGQEVAVLVESGQTAGGHTVHFEAGHLPSGVYLVRIEAGTFTQTQRILLLK